MFEINKAYIYESLNKIHSEKHIDIAPWIGKMIGTSEIPYEVIVFINKHMPIESFTTYNKIFEKRKQSKLFRNLVCETLPVEEKAIVLSSLLTQSLIGIKHADEEQREAMLDSMNVNIIMDAINGYLNNKDENIINDVFYMYQTIFKALFNR